MRNAGKLRILAGLPRASHPRSSGTPFQAGMRPNLGNRATSRGDGLRNDTGHGVGTPPVHRVIEFAWLKRVMIQVGIVHCPIHASLPKLIWGSSCLPSMSSKQDAWAMLR